MTREPATVIMALTRNSHARNTEVNVCRLKVGVNATKFPEALAKAS